MPSCLAAGAWLADRARAEKAAIAEKMPKGEQRLPKNNVDTEKIDTAFSREMGAAKVKKEKKKDLKG